MRVLFEFVDGTEAHMTRTHVYLDGPKINLRPVRANKAFPEELEQIKKDFANGVYPKRGVLLGVYHDDNGTEWIHVWFPEQDEERVYSTQYWMWN